VRHQLPGRFWCCQHEHVQLKETPLGELGWLEAPDHWGGRSSDVGRPWHSMTGAEQFAVERFFQYADRLADGDPAPSVVACQASILRRINSSQIRELKVPHSVSDFVWNQFPHWWLVEMDPGWLTKKIGVTHPYVDVFCDDAYLWALVASTD
jgi:hypothetical protein